MNGPVQPGERLEIRASTWNALRELERRQSLGEDAAPPRPVRGQLDALVHVKNTGADLARYGIVGLGAPVFSPSDNLVAFQSPHFALNSEAPTLAHQASFAIAFEPIAAGRIGRCVTNGAGGFIVCKLTVTDANCLWARCTTSTTELETAPYGYARIVYKETGTGAGKWALVQFAGNSGPFAISIPSTVAANASASCAYYTSGTTLSSQTVSVVNRSGSSLGSATAHVGYAYFNAQARELQFIQEVCP
jgi:hypothetical protein